LLTVSLIFACFSQERESSSKDDHKRREKKKKKEKDRERERGVEESHTPIPKLIVKGHTPGTSPVRSSGQIKLKIKLGDNPAVQ
jgi:hypothetical protein